MDPIIKLLNTNLKYLYHEIMDDTLYIFVESMRTEVPCPFCGTLSSKKHSTYQRNFQDLPIQGKKVQVVIHNRKMFCTNQECTYKTFSERFTWLNNKSKKTNRLQEEIIRLALNCSSVATSKMLSRNTATVGKSTICKLLKKS